VEDLGWFIVLDSGISYGVGDIEPQFSPGQAVTVRIEG
jgi:hypothetical protein